MYNYLEIPQIINLKKESFVCLSADLIQLALNLRKQEKNFDNNRFLNSFIDAVGKNGTICIPTFNFDFCNLQYYDYKKSKSQVGAIGNIALKNENFIRTMHPTHSFAVAGKNQKELLSLRNINPFGNDSPFDMFYKKDCLQIILGTDYQRAMTFIHYVEQYCKVPYRYMKTFIGTYVDSFGSELQKKVEYYVRDLKINPIEKFNRIGEILEEKGISKRYFFDDIPILVINLKESFPIIEDDILYNQSKNLYDFENENLINWKELQCELNCMERNG